jgi:hypothetical protein
MSRLVSVKVFLLVAIATLITGCGSGGSSNNSSSTPSSTPTSSDWDTLVWDQDNWS